MLKRIWQKIIREQKGQMLPLVLVLMLLSGLLIVPTLKYASTSLKAKQVTEKKTLELYAADSGVEEALSYLSQFAKEWDDPLPSGQLPSIGPYDVVPKGENPDRKLDYYERVAWAPPYKVAELVINGKTVYPVTVRREGSEESQYYYKITSTANTTGTDEGSTTVTSYVEFTDFSCLFDNLVTTSGNVKTDEGENHELIGRDPDAENYTGLWPTASQLREYYGEQIDEVADLYDDSSLDVDGYRNEEPLYRAGALDIYGHTADQESNVLKLQEPEGTVYITGALTMGKTSPGSKKFTLDLNEQTIFVEDTIDIGSGCAITGSGCIIALGEITFAPGVTTNSTQFVFVMSLEKVDFLPNPDFNGAIAAKSKDNDSVHLRTGTGTYNHTEPRYDLNFLLGGTDAPIAILSWQIS